MVLVPIVTTKLVRVEVLISLPPHWLVQVPFQLMVELLTMGVALIKVEGEVALLLS